MRRIIILASVLCAASMASGARADCFGEHGGADGEYAQLMRRDPDRAARQLEASIAATASAVSNGRPSLAQRYVMLADARDALGQREAARRAIRDGLASVGSGSDARIELRLRLREVALMEDSVPAHVILGRYEAVAQAVAPQDPYFICVLMDRGYFRYRAGDVGPAIEDLAKAGELSRARGTERDRIDVGSALSLVFQSLESFDEAVALAGAAIEFYQGRNEPFSLADAYYRRGRARTSMRDYGGAEPDLRQAVALATQIGDAPDAFYAQLTLCDLLVTTGRNFAAAPVCEDAARRAPALADLEGLARAQLLQGEILLATGHAARALSLFNAGLRQGESLLLPQFLARALRSRSRARAVLGDFRGALEDARRSAEFSDAVQLVLSGQKVAVLRVQSELARKDQELQLARQEAALSAARVDQSRVLRNFIIGIAALILLGGWLLAIALQRRRVAEAARQTAERQLESLGRLAAGVAHDFNNLLTVVQQASGMLARIPAVSADALATELVAATRDAAATGGSITSQLLSFGRQQNLRPETILLGEYFASQRAIWIRLAGEGAELQVSVEHPGLTVFADRAQLSSALINLLLNARDACALPGAFSIAAHADAPPQRRTRMTCIDIRDNGQGMAPEVLAHATEPFFSTKAPGRGSGLGLSAVEGFVRQSGGELQIRSEPGQGTMVSMILPRAARA